MLWPLVWILRVALTGAMFVYFAVGSFLLSWLVLPLVRRQERCEADRIRRCQAIVARGFVQFHTLMRWLRLIHFDPREVILPLPTTPCVIVANHPTLVDVTAMLATFGGACTVVRSGLFRSVLLGPLLRDCWNIDAGDGASMAGAAVIQGAMDRLTAGFPVLIFPEGSRSPPGGLRRFRRGAFEIACRAQVPLVPVFITCDPPTLTKGVAWYALPKRLARMTLEALEPIETRSYNGDAVLLAKHVRELYDVRLAAWRVASTDVALSPHRNIDPP